MGRLPFKALFCQEFGCQPSEYEERAFRKCSYWHARLLAPMIRAVKPDFFREEFKLINYLGEATAMREVNADLMEYSLLNRGRGRPLQTGFNLRISGRKTSDVIYKVFQRASPAEEDSSVPPPVPPGNFVPPA
jgi:hypothetical protein